jgi:hypothetical protein
MCRERRAYLSDEHKTIADAEPSKEQERKREEVVRTLLHEADRASQSIKLAPVKAYIPAK